MAILHMAILVMTILLMAILVVAMMLAAHGDLVGCPPCGAAQTIGDGHSVRLLVTGHAKSPTGQDGYLIDYIGPVAFYKARVYASARQVDIRLPPRATLDLTLSTSTWPNYCLARSTTSWTASSTPRGRRNWGSSTSRRGRGRTTHGSWGLSHRA